MNTRCTIDDMGHIIEKEYEHFVDLTTEEVKKICKEVADDVCEKIKETAPVDTGKYKKSWSVDETSKSRQGASYTVHAGQYQLTHLLENGHAKRGGGRTRSFPHISVGEELAITEIKQRIGG